MTRLALIFAVLLTAGCSSSGGKGAATTTSSRASASSSGFVTSFGQDAALLLSHVPGCQFVSSQPINDSETSSGMVGEASCKLDGHSVLLFTWKDAASANAGATIVGGSALLYSAAGVGWTQIMGDDAAPDAQKQIADTVAAALGGKVTG